MTRLLLCLVTVMLSMSLDAADYTLNTASSRVTFTSEAPLETVRGRARVVSGTLTVNPEHPTPMRAEIIVNTVSMETGNRMRDKKMRNDFLQVAQYPTIRFRLTQCTIAEGLPEGKSRNATAKGEFTLHGVTRQIAVPVRITRTATAISVFPAFALQLSTYGIQRPEFLFMKLSETITISAMLRFDLKQSPVSGDQ
jgi:polyisoprenoid-binding protein YceI